MGDLSCLIRGFSYASAPNDAKQGNCMHSLGESISFGRFTSEPLCWEKWSTFSTHRKYVEEAESYAQPGSVAEKKAFFEAHFKRIAAERAAAQALIEQQNTTEKEEAETVGDPQKMEEDDDVAISVDGQQMEKPLLEKKKVSISSVPNQENNNPASEIPPPSGLTMDKKKSCSKSLWSVMNAAYTVKGPHKDLYATTSKRESKGFATLLRTPKLGASKVVTSPAQTTSKRESKGFATLLRTPKLGVSKVVTSPAQTAQLENRRMKTASDFSASGCKTGGTKWHKLSSACTKSFTACRNRLQNTTLSTPFVLRTEQRAAIRKQKLEEKFSACEAQKTLQSPKTLKGKAGKEMRKLSHSLCFKATTLPPDLYNQNRSPKKTRIRIKEKETQGIVASSVPSPLSKHKPKNDKNLLRGPLLEKNVL